MNKRTWCAIEYTNKLPLIDALWWFIENVTDDDPQRNELFFRLRERMRELIGITTFTQDKP